MNWIVITLSIIGALNVLGALLWVAWHFVQPIVRERDPKLKDWAKRRGLR